MRRLSQYLLAALLPLGHALFAQDPLSLLHKQAPAFTRADLHHQPVNLASYRGKVVLLSFWATWCAPCQIEMPRFVQWQQQYAGQGLQVLGISMDDDAEPVAALLQKRHVNYPVLMGDADLGKLYGGVLGLPVTFLIDRQGKIAAQYKGAASLPAMQRAILQLLNAKIH